MCAPVLTKTKKKYTNLKIENTVKEKMGSGDMEVKQLPI